MLVLPAYSRAPEGFPSKLAVLLARDLQLSTPGALGRGLHCYLVLFSTTGARDLYLTPAPWDNFLAS